MDKILFVCEFCGSKLSTSAILDQHKRRSRKCLALQAKLLPPECINTSMKTCLKCEKQYPQAYIKDHTLSCKGNLDIVSRLSRENEKLKLELESLKKDLKDAHTEIEPLSLPVSLCRRLRQGLTTPLDSVEISPLSCV